jgi:DNA (cytosine-5)-methyltransferase 1
VSIIENVKGLTFEKHAAYLDRTLGAARRLGYDLEWRVLNSADYGVPQTRERFICIARRDGGPIRWPTVTHTREPGLFTERWVSMADALGWTGEYHYRRGDGMAERHGERGPWRAEDGPAPTVHRNSAKDLLLDTRTMNVVLDYRQNAPTPDGPVPIIADLTGRPSPTIGTQSAHQWLVTRQWVHDRPATLINGDVRVSAPGRHDPKVSGSQQADAIPVTIPELARLQDFPDGYRFCGTKTDQARQIGNACPRTLVRVLAAANRPEGT